MVAEITALVDGLADAAPMASQQRLRDYLLALGQLEAPTPASDSAPALRLPELLRIARGRQGQPRLPLATPPSAPLSMPTREIPLCCRTGALPALARRFGHSAKS